MSAFIELSEQRKRRTPEEIAIANAEKDAKRQEREAKRLEVAKKAEEKALAKQQMLLRKERYSTQLFPGKEPDAITAMHIFELCKRNMDRVNLAFRQMIASRIIFPPKKNINKFATGGIAEECISQLLCDLGLICNNVSEDSNIIDLEIHVPDMASFKVSMKNSGKISSQPILENYRGQKRMDIRPLPPTFIVYTEMDISRARIVYIDEEIVRQGYPDLSDDEFHREIYLNGDSNLTFKSGFLSKFIPRLPSEYIVTADYPESLGAMTERNFSRLALEEVVRQLHNAV